MKIRQLVNNNAFNVYNYVKKSGCANNRKEDVCKKFHFFEYI